MIVGRWFRVGDGVFVLLFVGGNLGIGSFDISLIEHEHGWGHTELHVVV